MASYPTSVKSFVSRVTGDVIQAAHVNDLQDEVNALEAGLIQGTAHLQSSNSTVAALTVSGGTTLASLSVTGNSTITTALIGDLSVVQHVPHARIFHSTVVAVAHNTITAIPFDSIEFASTTGIHSTISSSNFYLNAASSGLYHILLNVQWNGGSTAGDRFAMIRYNDGTVIAQSWVSANVGTPSHTVACYQRMQQGDFVNAWVFQNSGTTGSLGATTSTGRGFTDFTMTKIR